MTHFPHAFQQLLRCWSYWSEHSDQKAVLELPFSYRKHNIWKQRRPFLDGFLRDLRKLGVKIVVKQPTDLLDPTKPKIPFQMRSPEDAASLARAIRRRHRIPNDNNAASRCHSTVTIGILNRTPQSRRSILNIDAVVEALHTAFRDNNNNSSLSDVNIEVAYFEGASYVDQVRFVSTVDILISPHGAQLTGLFLLSAQRCGRILEVFPSHFYMSAFFGSLADCSGVAYYSLYLTAADNHESNLTSVEQIHNVKSARGSQLCPDPAVMVEAVQRVVADWYECCADRG